MRPKYKILLSLFVFTLILDQWTKHLVVSRFRWGESLSVIESYFNITYVRNKGAAFGFLNSAPDSFREPFFYLVPVVVLLGIGIFFWRLKDQERWVITALSLIFSGAVGNLIDRIRFGYVVDFLDFHWKNLWHYWAFNVADSCIVIGVAMIFLQPLFQRKPSL